MLSLHCGPPGRGKTCRSVILLHRLESWTYPTFLPSKERQSERRHQECQHLLFPKCLHDSLVSSPYRSKAVRTNALHCRPHFFYLMRCVPTSVGTCSMEYEVYRHKEASDEDFDYIDSSFKRVLNEDKYLCDEVQKNLNAGVFVNGQLHPGLESAPLFFQNTVRSLLRKHREEEKREKKEL